MRLKQDKSVHDAKSLKSKIKAKGKMVGSLREKRTYLKIILKSICPLELLNKWDRKYVVHTNETTGQALTVAF